MLSSTHYNRAMSNLHIPRLGAFDDIAAYVECVGNAARTAARAIARAETAAKNAALVATAAAIRRDEGRLLSANAEDVTAARGAGHDAAFIDRLTLNLDSIAAMADGLLAIAAL